MVNDMTKMKESGIQWIGEIPENWNICPTKRFFKHTKILAGEQVDSYERLALTMTGVIKRSKDDSEGLQPEKFDTYQVLRNNELVFKLIDLSNVKTSRVGLSPYTGIVSPAYIVLTNENEDNRFYYYYFISMYYNEIFNNLGDNGVRSSLNAQDLLNIPMVDIPSAVQKRIADFLDDKCSKIDYYIEKQQQIIEKLKDYKQAVITEAVTKGLDSNVPMKDSGVEWIGMIPKWWVMSHIGNLAEIGSGGTPDRNKREYWEEGTIPWMSSGEINYEYVYDTFEKITSLGMNNSNAKLLPVNTVMLGLIGQGKTKGLTAILKTECTCNQNLAYLIAKPSLLHYQYLFYCFKSMYFFIRGLVGDSQAGIYQYFLKKQYIPLPPLDEQIQISNYLNNLCNLIDEKIKKILLLVDKLNDYKKSLIYETVTGKLEV